MKLLLAVLTALSVVSCASTYEYAMYAEVRREAIAQYCEDEQCFHDILQGEISTCMEENGGMEGQSMARIIRYCRTSR